MEYTNEEIIEASKRFVKTDVFLALDIPNIFRTCVFNGYTNGWVGKTLHQLKLDRTKGNIKAFLEKE